MKLVDILARELEVWPDGVRIITQQDSGYLFDEGNYPLDMSVEVAEDNSVAAITHPQWRAAVDALKAEVHPTESMALHHQEVGRITRQWNGDGLPHVGAVCEFEMALAGWVPATITAVTQKSIVFTRPLFKDRTGLDYGNTHEEMLPHRAAKRFRPIRTPEQIAAEEREVAINAMIDTLGHPTAILMRESILGALYDAGYRKFEIVDN